MNFEAGKDVIDTVFNEKHYYKFVEKIEAFAKVYINKFGQKPTLQDFNNFVLDNNLPLWKEINAIRFQDLPLNDKRDYLQIKGFFYKKRIQIALFDATKMTKKSLTHQIENQNLKK